MFLNRSNWKTRTTRRQTALWEKLECRQLLSAVPNLIAQPMGNAVSLDGTVPVGKSAPWGYSAYQIRHAYGVDNINFNGLTGDGSGQTVAIINAYDNPQFVDTGSPGFANSDLHKFDVAMNLPDPPSFQKVDQNGHTNYPSTSPGWANEAALDVEWVHAAAPKANILLVEAYSPGLNDLVNTAVQYARQVPGVSEITMSFAAPDSPSETSYDSYFQTPGGHNGVTFVAASGDKGSQGGYPAFSPNVVGVGSTTLSLTGSSTIQSETGQSTSGGGFSQYESKPAYQYPVSLSSTRRMSPDVALNGDMNTGVSVFDSFNGGSLPWYKVGGTSFSAPFWAGLFAVTNQGRAHLGLGTLDGPSQTLPRLYTLNNSDFHDITTGNNGYAAGSGYDLVTGLGTPVANKLVTDLAGGNSVSGTVFNDINSNGRQDSGEGPLSGWGTFVDLYNSGSHQGLDPQVLSGSNGFYQFNDLPGGTYRFNQTTPNGYKKTTPSYYTITIGYGYNLGGFNIGNHQGNTPPNNTGSISGYVFGDSNRDGRFDNGEHGLAGITVYLDLNKDGKQDNGEYGTVTNSNGYYYFGNLPNGTFRIRETVPSGKGLTNPTVGYYDIVISNGWQVTNEDWGNV